MAASLTVLVVAAPVSAAPDPGPVDDVVDPAEQARDHAVEQVELATDRLEQARDVLRIRLEAADAARRGGRAADGEVRRAEEALPDAVVAVAEATAHLAATERTVRRLERERDRLVDELAVARDVLEERAMRAFKVGHLGELSGPVALVREARDPGELAHTMGHLRGLTRDGARTVREVTAAIEVVREELAVAVAAHAAARDALAVAEGDRDARELATTAARDRAAAAEVGVLASFETELVARAAVDRAIEALVEATREAVRAEVAAAHAETAASLAEEAREVLTPEDAEQDRVDEVAGRRRAHQRQVSLPAEHRRVAEGWHCPVVAGRFVNDWSFPRSGDRRHEGTDVFAPRGTAIVALADGVVSDLQRVERAGSLGGRTVAVTAGEHRHYYAHLDHIPDGLAVGDPVAAGDLIGTVGTTGNARGTPPHLHLGWYVRDTAVNPYASLAVACREDG